MRLSWGISCPRDPGSLASWPGLPGARAAEAMLTETPADHPRQGPQEAHSFRDSWAPGLGGKVETVYLGKGGKGVWEIVMSHEKGLCTPQRPRKRIQCRAGAERTGVAGSELRSLRI